MKAVFYWVALVILVSSGCLEKKEYNNLDKVDSIDKGDSMEMVVKKMDGVPDYLIVPDSTFYYGKMIKELTTFVYKTPKFSSSDIYVYLKDCEVHHVFYD